LSTRVVFLILSAHARARARRISHRRVSTITSKLCMQIASEMTYIMSGGALNSTHSLRVCETIACTNKLVLIPSKKRI